MTPCQPLTSFAPPFCVPGARLSGATRTIGPGCSLSSAFSSPFDCLGSSSPRPTSFFDEAQYCSWSRDLAFGYFSKPAAVAYPTPMILVTAELLRQAKSVLTDNRDVSGGCSIAFATHRRHHNLVSRIDDTTLNQSRAGARALRYAEPGHDLRAEALLLSSSNWKAAISD